MNCANIRVPKVCEDGILLQLLIFCIHCPVFLFKTTFQRLGSVSIDWAQLSTLLLDI
jgi:hypothetical protein